MFYVLATIWGSMFKDGASFRKHLQRWLWCTLITGFPQGYPVSKYGARISGMVVLCCRRHQSKDILGGRQMKIHVSMWWGLYFQREILVWAVKTSQTTFLCVKLQFGLNTVLTRGKSSPSEYPIFSLVPCRSLERIAAKNSSGWHLIL